MHASKMINGLGRIGGGLTAFSLVSAGVTYAYSDQSGSDNARLAGSVIIMTTSFIPFAGPFISLGLGTADAYGAFDKFYNSFDDD